MMSPYAIIFAFVGYKVAALLLSSWVKRCSAKWELRLKSFVADHDGKLVAGDRDKRLLFIVVPSSGAGRAMDLYDECIEELQKRDENFYIETYVTKSSDDIKTLLERRRNDISKLYGLILLGGDSSITELIQGPMAQNKDRWTYPPILHLPGGSTNLLSKELHHGNPTGRFLASSRSTRFVEVVRSSYLLMAVTRYMRRILLFTA